MISTQGEKSIVRGAASSLNGLRLAYPYRLPCHSKSAVSCLDAIATRRPSQHAHQQRLLLAACSVCCTRASTL